MNVTNPPDSGRNDVQQPSTERGPGGPLGPERDRPSAGRGGGDGRGGATAGRFAALLGSGDEAADPRRVERQPGRDEGGEDKGGDRGGERAGESPERTDGALAREPPAVESARRPDSAGAASGPPRGVPPAELNAIAHGIVRSLRVGTVVIGGARGAKSERVVHLELSRGALKGVQVKLMTRGSEVEATLVATDARAAAAAEGIVERLRAALESRGVALSDLTVRLESGGAGGGADSQGDPDRQAEPLEPTLRESDEIGGGSPSERGPERAETPASGPAPTRNEYEV